MILFSLLLLLTWSMHNSSSSFFISQPAASTQIPNPKRSYRFYIFYGPTALISSMALRYPIFRFSFNLLIRILPYSIQIYSVYWFPLNLYIHILLFPDVSERYRLPPRLLTRFYLHALLNMISNPSVILLPPYFILFFRRPLF